MNRKPTSIVLLTGCSLAFAWAGAIAQQQETQPATQPQQTQQTQSWGEQSEPEAASSPHQRDATRTRTTEAPTTSEMGSPESASSPHQRSEPKTDRTNVAERERALTDCIKTQQQNDAAMSKDAAKKACMEQQRMRNEPRG
jgi:hypothetical protein